LFLIVYPAWKNFVEGNMVVKCKMCKGYAVFHAWLGAKSRVLAGCQCENSVWIYGKKDKEIIYAQDFSQIEIWHSVEQNWISYERYHNLCT